MVNIESWLFGIVTSLIFAIFDQRSCLLTKWALSPHHVPSSSTDLDQWNRSNLLIPTSIQIQGRAAWLMYVKKVQMRVSPGSAGLSQFNWQTVISRLFTLHRLEGLQTTGRFGLSAQKHTACVSTLSHNNWYETPSRSQHESCNCTPGMHRCSSFSCITKSHSQGRGPVYFHLLKLEIFTCG